MKKYRVGLMLLAVYLILVGLTQVIGLTFNYLPLVEGVLAVASGVLLFLGQ